MELCSPSSSLSSSSSESCRGLSVLRTDAPEEEASARRALARMRPYLGEVKAKGERAKKMERAPLKLVMQL